MEQPSGFINLASPNHVCKLHRSIYGLKKAQRAWFSYLSSYLVTMGFAGSKSDTFFFLWRVRTDLLPVLIYANDIIITGNDSRAVTRLSQELGWEFSLKDLGPLHYFLGVECHRTPSCLFLSQQKYTRSLLLWLKMDGVKPVSSPMATSCKLSKVVGKSLWPLCLSKYCCGSTIPKLYQTRYCLFGKQGRSVHASSNQWALERCKTDPALPQIYHSTWPFPLSSFLCTTYCLYRYILGRVDRWSKIHQWLLCLS